MSWYLNLVGSTLSLTMYCFFVNVAEANSLFRYEKEIRISWDYYLTSKYEKAKTAVFPYFDTKYDYEARLITALSNAAISMDEEVYKELLELSPKYDTGNLFSVDTDKKIHFLKKYEVYFHMYHIMGASKCKKETVGQDEVLIFLLKSDLYGSYIDQVNVVTWQCISISYYYRENYEMSLAYSLKVRKHIMNILANEKPSVQDLDGLKMSLFSTEYNISIAYAKLGYGRLAVHWLEGPLRYSTTYYSTIENDKDFDGIRGREDYKNLMYKRRSHEKN